MHKNYNMVPERPQFDPDVYGNAMNNRVPVFSCVGRGPKGKDGEKGEKGDPMTIEDMSAEQLQQLIDDIRAEITTRMANIKDVTVYTDGVNTTVFDLTDIFPDWAMEYLVFVNVEGLDLSYGTDYTIVGDQLTLTNPIVHDHTRVDFRFLYFEFINDTNSYAYIMSLIGSGPTPDYNITDALGNHEERIVELDMNHVHAFDTVADMKLADDLRAGMICHTNGFHTSGDGGAAWYEISDTGAANEIDVIACGDLLANYIYESEANVKQMGVTASMTTTAALTLINQIIALGKYPIIYIPADVNYGYDRHDDSVKLNTTASGVKCMVIDDSIDDSYNDVRSEVGMQRRYWFNTPDALREGQHDGNGILLKGNWHPYINIDSYDDDDAENTGHRASLFFSRNGNVQWQVTQSISSSDDKFGIVRTDSNNDTHIEFAIDKETGNIAFGSSNTNYRFLVKKNPLFVPPGNEFFAARDNETLSDATASYSQEFSDSKTTITERWGTSQRVVRKFYPNTGAMKLYNADNKAVTFGPTGTYPFTISDFTTGNDQFRLSDAAGGWFRNGVSGNSGTTANRPATPQSGAMFFDTTLGKPIWYNGTSWVDATGASV